MCARLAETISESNRLTAQLAARLVTENRVPITEAEVFARDLRGVLAVYLSQYRPLKARADSLGVSVLDFVEQTMAVALVSVVPVTQSVLRECPPIVKAGPIIMDTIGLRCYVDDEEITLRPTEFGILRELVRNARRPVSRLYLSHTLWSSPYDVGSTINVHVYRVRRKLGKHANMVRVIRRIGYCLDAPE